MIRLTKSALASLIAATLALQQVSAAGIFGRPSALSRWGGRSSSVGEKSLLLSQRTSLYEVRGGSTEVEEQGTVDAEQLYLPGLLDASVVRSNSVRTSVSMLITCYQSNC